MKTKLFLWISVMGVMACSENITPVSTPAEPVDYPVFYDQLAPYGSWINYPPYGSVWVPSVAVGFTPYLTNGYWFYSNYGWTWYSYYSWGWAPFHYGRWYFDIMVGWLWIPDTVWGPGWVAWRMGGGYCGWAPLGPGVSVNIIVSGGHSIAHDHWIFIHERDFTNRNVEQHRVDRTMNTSLVQRSDLIRTTRSDRNTVYLSGPDREQWQRQSGQSVTPVKISRGRKPGRYEINNNKLEMYRPSFNNEPRAIDRDLGPGRTNRSTDRNIKRSWRPFSVPKQTDRNPNTPKVKPRTPQPRSNPNIKTPPPVKPRKRGN